MDLEGAVKLIDAARTDGIRRYLIVSSMGAGDPPADGGGVFGEYLRAKAGADRALVESGLDYTIVRPGSLTDDPPTGRVAIGADLPRGEVSRADVAATLAVALAPRRDRQDLRAPLRRHADRGGPRKPLTLA